MAFVIIFTKISTMHYWNSMGSRWKKEKGKKGNKNLHINIIFMRLGTLILLDNSVGKGAR